MKPEAKLVNFVEIKAELLTGRVRNVNSPTHSQQNGVEGD